MPERRLRTYEVGVLDDFDVNRFRIFDLGGKSVGVVRTQRGFYAMLNHCPHAGGRLCRGQVTGSNLPSQPDSYEYGLRDQLVRCPWHGWEFEISSGRSPFGVTKARAKTYAVQVRGQSVNVLMPTGRDMDE
jgi:3-phenylpropionate/trans-cinnamate dioxygenase ferredoxin subunit